MGGGGYSGPNYDPPAPPPEKLPTKSISAGAAAAAEAQREKQRKNRGLAASIMTTQNGMAVNDSGGSKTLG